MRRIQRINVLLLVVLLLSLLLGVGCSGTDPFGGSTPPVEQALDTEKADGHEPFPIEGIPSEGLLTVHFIDVGQGDACLVQLLSGQTILIDGGEKAAFNALREYLQGQDIDRIDYLVATHPHSDHIGGLIEIMEGFSIGKVYMPRVAHTTNTYVELLEAIKRKGLKITPAKAGLELEVGNGLEAQFIAPNSDHYDDLNNYSAVLKLTYGEVSFLFTGDAEEQSEVEMLNSEADLQAQVLKVGHHGSITSTTPKFLAAVAPEVAVISLGKDNSYGHPHEQVERDLETVGALVLRTDLVGTIIITSNGQEIIGISTPAIPMGNT